MTHSALAASAGAWFPVRPKGPLVWLSVIAVSVLLMLIPAIWNGFPFMFYDTGSFIEQAMQGGFVAERSAFYAWFLAIFQPGYSLWPAIMAQVLMTVLVMTEFARVLAPDLSPFRFLGMICLLILGTGLPWVAGQVLPDILTGILVLCVYLLGFHAAALSWPRKAALVAVAIFAVNAHASHLGLAAGLTAIVILLQLAMRRLKTVSASPRAGLPALVFGVSLLLLVTSNFIRTGDVFISRAGPAFLFGRLVQDGVAQRLLKDTCPESGYRLCAYKNDLPDDADDYLWGWDSPFQKLGRFEGTEAEASRMIVDSLKRYPLMHLKLALRNTGEQLAAFHTGDGFEGLHEIPVPALEHTIPGQMAGYRASRQENNQLEFSWVNAFQVPLGVISVAALAAILAIAVQRRHWGDRTFLPVFLLLALLGNAFICGVLSNPQDRYQSRLMWAASFGALLLVTPRLRPTTSPAVARPDDLAAATA